MGEVIDLAGRRLARVARAGAAGGAQPAAVGVPAEFFFDLSCPFTYLAAERIERSFSDITWRPASAAALHRLDPESDLLTAERMRRAAEARAAQLRMPLQWPDRFPGEVPAAMRAAAFAAEQGRASSFVLAAGRLAFCGGFDLDDPEILAEAAAASGISLEGCLDAAGDTGRDGSIEDAGRRLLAAGADRLPAIRVGRTLLWGEDRIAAMALAGGAAVAALSLN